MFNPQVHRKLWLVVVAAGLLTVGSCSQQPTNQATATAKKGETGKSSEATKLITVPKGTPISATVDQALTSNKNHSGDSFAASLSQPVKVGGKIVIPKGTHLVGRVVTAKKSGRLRGPAELRVTLASVEVHGKSYNLETNSIGESGKSHAKHHAPFRGGGSAAAKGKRDITLPAESHLTFKLVKSVNVPVKG